MGTFYVSNGCFWSKVLISAHLAALGYLKPFKFSIKCHSVPFGLIRIHFNHCKNRIQIFNFCLFNRLYRESAVTVGSETHFKDFLKGIFVQEGSCGTHFDHGQFEIKTFPIYAPPY